MNTYLLTWNPNKYPWTNFKKEISEFKKTGKLFKDWSCGITKSVQKGDRFFHMRLGKEPKGIFASGFALSEVYQREHWDNKDESANYFETQYDFITDPESEKNFLTLENLESRFPNQLWTPQSSGISIKKEVADQLEELWKSIRT